MHRLGLLVPLLVSLACAPPQGDSATSASQTGPSADAVSAARPDKISRPSADIVRVETREVEDGYQFAVGIASPDTGCEQYANWWEVVSEEGELLYRRPLSHSHVDEQPFVRSGGPVPIDADTIVWVRAHLHPIGYGRQAYKGSVAAGFEAAEAPRDFALDLADVPPSPPNCRW